MPTVVIAPFGQRTACAVASPARPFAAGVLQATASAVASLSRPATGAVVDIIASAPFKGFGFVRYAQAAADAPLALQPGVRTALTMTVDPTQTLAAARAPFDQVAFWDGTTLQTPAVNDLLDLRIGVVNTLIGRAISTTELELNIQQPILL